MDQPNPAANRISSTEFLHFVRTLGRAFSTPPGRHRAWKQRELQTNQLISHTQSEGSSEILKPSGLLSTLSSPSSAPSTPHIPAQDHSDA